MLSNKMPKYENNNIYFYNKQFASVIRKKLIKRHPCYF